MPIKIDYIENTQLLTSIFGRWPSFHDAEFRQLQISRPSEGPTRVNVSLLVFELTEEINKDGNYIQANHTLVDFEFANSEVEGIRLTGFPDILLDMRIEPSAERQSDGFRLRVVLESAIEGGIEFLCEKAVIRNAIPVQPSSST